MSFERVENASVLPFPGSDRPRAVLSSFVHLRVHSAYSLLEGAIHVSELAKLCRAHVMPAVAVTDTGNLFGAVEIADVLSANGIQPIIGCTLSVDTAAPTDRGPRAPAHNSMYPTLALLVQNETGWTNLSKLSSKSYLSVAPQEAPHVRLSDLAAHQEGLICLSGGPAGPINRLILQSQMPAARLLMQHLAEIFPRRFYVELQRHGLSAEAQAEAPLVEWAYEFGLPLVATNEAYFADESLYEAHDVLLCIADGTYVGESNRRRVTREHRFKSVSEMLSLFEDLPEAISNTIEIARRCAFMPKKRAPILPRFEVTSGRTPADELRVQAHEGLRRRLGHAGLFVPEEEYWKRLEYELEVIIKVGFESYFLIVSDFMKWARKHGIPVGVRGSGATSIVAWSLEITALDPLRFRLVFERFLNPERKSMPDFDIDFCQDRRGEVIRYVQEKYGYDRVAQIITYGTLQARAAVRDVGRVLQMPYGQVDRISKLIPNAPGQHVTIRQAIESEPRLKEMEEKDEEVKRLFSIVGKIEGLYRHASTHAAGIVIGDRPLDELVPLYRDPKSDMPVTQFDYKDNETVGLVKFDFLGLKTLTVIARTEELLAARGVQVKTEEVGFDDKKTYEMLSRGEAVGVFQMESSGMRDLMRKLKPDRIEDLIALVALYRPGPMQSIPKYIACKHGQEKPSYLHPSLEPILSDTYGVMTYQEDVMLIARELAGYSMGEADNLRRAMGKKDKEEMAKNREKFISRAAERGIPRSVAAEIFDQAEKFAGYGFNKGHAAAYAQVAYQTAYLKANYPAEFLSASMTLDIGQSERLNIFRQEAERLGIKVLAPDINRSEAQFSTETLGDGSAVIRYALAAVRNVGQLAMAHVVELRKQDGPFRSIFDFARRIDPRCVNKRALESLAAAGAFDALNPNRAQVVASVDLLLSHAGGAARERVAGQASLFDDDRFDVKDPPLPLVDEWSVTEKLQREFEAIGFYLSGHPLDGAAAALKRAGVVLYADLAHDPKHEARLTHLAGTVVARQDRKSRERDTPYAFVSLSDPSGIFEVVVFADALRQHGALLEPGQSIVLSVLAEWNGEDLKLRVQNVRSLDSVVAETGAGLRVFVQEAGPLASVATCLSKPGRGVISLVLMLGDGREVDVEIPGRYTVTPQIRNSVKAVQGVVEVEDV